MEKLLYSIIKKNTMFSDKKLDYLEKTVLSLVKDQVVGDIAECGVWMGGAVALIAKVLLDNNDTKFLRLFDSFNDPHECKPVDGSYLIDQLGGKQRATGKLVPIEGYYNKVTKGIGPGNPKKVFNLLAKTIGYPEDKIKIYKGWVQTTLPQYSKRIEKISMLILDCDLYEPQRLCLEYLYDKVVPNGIVIVDDYYSLEGCSKAVDEFRSKLGINEEIKRVSNTSCIFWVKK